MKSFNFTYNDILSKAAHSLYTQISQLDNGKIPAQNSLYRNNQITHTLGAGVSYILDNNKGPAEKTYTFGTIEVNAESYTLPSESQILEDMKSFMKEFGLDKPVTEDGLVSFFFALNFFIEKAIIKKHASAQDNNVSYFIHYQKPELNSYVSYITKAGLAGDKNTTFTIDNSVSQDKISAIYDQLKTSELSDGVRPAKLSFSSSSNSSSCSSSSSSSCSSSCSSSSSSSSSLFIAYFNLN